MKPSSHDGEQILYVDPVGIAHTGVIVGQSDDDQWYYVQSDNPIVPPREWHFKVSGDILQGIIA